MLRLLNIYFGLYFVYIKYSLCSYYLYSSDNYSLHSKLPFPSSLVSTRQTNHLRFCYYLLLYFRFFFFIFKHYKIVRTFSTKKVISISYVKRYHLILFKLSSSSLLILSFLALLDKPTAFSQTFFILNLLENVVVTE